ncbi:hypothetical protein GCM10009733_029580 [Nonomuraea maheshkhaliensis]|uniref:Uncharacterized protein n=1 Tax=Nonomuraea maheshkhaliensis TaxID=419590 RepID=A0ABN2F4V3_9ACTN
MSEVWDDEELLARLIVALTAADAVPRDFVEAGKTAFAWHNIDAELAELAYDSGLQQDEEAALLRADPAALRALTFVAAELSIELEITEGTLIGQLVPPQAGRIHVLSESGYSHVAAVDEMGVFVLNEKPPEPFRLQCRTVTGLSVSTDWIRL